MVCKKSGLAPLTRGIGAGAVSFSHHAHCRVDRRALLQMTQQLEGQTPLPPRESLERKKVKCIAFIHIISRLVLILFR